MNQFGYKMSMEEQLSALRKENDMFSRTLIGMEQDNNKLRKFLYILKNKTLKTLHLKLQEQSIKLKVPVPLHRTE